MLEFVLQRPDISAIALSELTAALPPEVRIAALRRDSRISPRLQSLSWPKATCCSASHPPGRRSTGARSSRRSRAGPYHRGPPRSRLSPRLRFADHRGGMELGDLVFGPATRRQSWCRFAGDTDLLPETGSGPLEFGDRVGLLAHRADFPALREYFGDSIKGGRVQLHFDRSRDGPGFPLGAMRSRCQGSGRVSTGTVGSADRRVVPGIRLRRRPA